MAGGPVFVFVPAAATERARQPAPAGLIPLTCNELGRLFAALTALPPAT